MNRILSRFCDDQFAAFKKDLIGDWGVEAKTIDALAAELKPIHKQQLALACLATAIGRHAVRGDYISSISEVSYLALVLAAKGNENSAYVLLRQLIELVLKHVFFSTHPVEYGWAATREGYREVTFQFLLDYLRKTDESHRFGAMEEVCIRLEHLFGTLSRYVHVHSKLFMVHSGKKRDAALRQVAIRSVRAKTQQLWPLLLEILIIHFPAKYLRANSVEQALIRLAIPKVAGVRVKTYLKKLSVS